MSTKLFNKLIRLINPGYQPTSKYIEEISKLAKKNVKLYKELVTYQYLNNNKYIQAKEDARFKRMVKERNPELYTEIVDILVKDMLIKDKEKIKELEKIVNENSRKTPTKIHLTKLAAKDLKRIIERDKRAEEKAKRNSL